MANEATLLTQTSIPINFTVANGTGIEKGTLLVLADPMTAIAGTDTTSLCAGVAAVEKIASDGITKLAVHRDGIFKGIASGSISVGDPLGYLSGSSWPNYLSSLVNTAVLSGSKVWGIALETCTNGETFKWELRPSLGVG